MASDDDWFAPASDEEAEGAEGSDSDDSGASRGGKSNNKLDTKVKKGKTKPGGNKDVVPRAKAKGKAKPLVACSAARCENKKAGKSRFCERHRPYYQASQYQAERTNNLKIHNQVFSDPEKAASALAKLEKENPPGMGHRKTVVDWGAMGEGLGSS